MEQIKDKVNNIIQEHCYYDIIGDVHGNATELEQLLPMLGYKQIYGIWRHTRRKAVFVGDFIHRGPNSRRVLEIVKDMVKYGFAHAILGNHELYAIFHLSKNKDGKPFKKISDSSKKMAEQLKSEFHGEEKLLKKYIKWMRTLPIHLDFGAFRVVHAYWNDDYARIIAQHRTEGSFSKKALAYMADSRHPLGNAVEKSTKGIEFNLPKDLIIKDSDNNRRGSFRIGWWKPAENKTFRELAYGNKFTLPDYTIPRQILFPYKWYSEKEPMVFFGHYCMDKNNMVVRNNICCVDACAANGGTLAAYCWQGETEMDANHLVFL
ncbi:Calcineurin-like phosphoesterase [Saccharicrinis carchari]|uniref:Calcineurin-like phosphoesterase n=1 Tax=Saccharicrinis carchari TaxID=1168039 RepID=A0A521AVW8_SACCC|nr:metallophosphoesterase [Saccharicrinis carchari]SMO38986.1 Calcineurin-like phosphoesterase [Saccharicrinis carchari]